MMRNLFVRSAYNYDPDENSSNTAVDTTVDPETGEVVKPLTQQSFKDECDINEIVRRFGLTGEIPEDYRAPQSGDFSGISDYKSAMDAIRQADEAFMELPGELRERFNNDPQNLLEFVHDAKNLPEAVELGLVPRKPEATRDTVQAIDELRAAIVAPKGSAS